MQAGHDKGRAVGGDETLSFPAGPRLRAGWPGGSRSLAIATLMSNLLVHKDLRCSWIDI